LRRRIVPLMRIFISRESVSPERIFLLVRNRGYQKISLDLCQQSFRLLKMLESLETDHCIKRKIGEVFRLGLQVTRSWIILRCILDCILGDINPSYLESR